MDDGLNGGCQVNQGDCCCESEELAPTPANNNRNEDTVRDERVLHSIPIPTGSLTATGSLTVGNNIGSDYSPRAFSVKPLNYGYVITVGCHSFAVETPIRLIEILTEYITDPNAKEKKWWQNKTI